MPTRKVVASRCMRSIGYEKKTKRLDIEFRKSGAVYRYSGVGARAAANLEKASSRGRHFNRNVRNAYAYEKIRAGRRRTKAKRTR